MKKTSILLGIGVMLTGIMTFSMMGASLSSHPVQTKQAEAIGNYSTNASTYYSGITASSGKQLAAQLHDLITSTHQYYSSYDDNGKNLYQQNTDQYYENGNKVNGYINEFYSGVKWPNAWASNAGDTTGGYNREHCWCQSNSVNQSGTQMWGTTGGGSDMHHIRPVESRLNSTRNNHPYGEVTNRDSKKSYAKYGTQTTYALGGYTDNTADIFEPIDSKKGDVARIILYIYLHYNSYTNSTLFGSYGTTNGSGSSSYFTSSLLSLTKTVKVNSEAEALEMLLRWNNNDPVDELEQRRNEQVAKYQGNRNPFIDNSNYANAIWGTAGVSISRSETSVVVGSTTTLSASSTNSSTITWSTSNSSVASLNTTSTASGSSVTITGVAVGSATITARATISGQQYTSTCVVDVVDDIVPIDPEDGSFSWDLSIASYDANPTANQVTWSHSVATMVSTKVGNGTSANNYLGGDSNNRTSSRFYTGNTLRFTPASGYNITSVVFNATSSGYASTLANSSWTNATAVASNTTVTITPTDGTSAFYATIGGTCGGTLVTVNYEGISSGDEVTLSSISISGYTTQFTVGDTFSFGGTVTAYYSDDTSADVTASAEFSGYDMSQAGEQTVYVSYTEGGSTEEESYTITVSQGITSVTISPSELELDLNGTTSGTLTATVNGGNNSAQTVTWNSSDDSVATVNNGVVTAVSVGNATITATSTVDNTKSGSCSVTVTDSGQGEVPQTGIHTFKKITTSSELKAGTYMIVYETGNVAFDGSLTTLDAVGDTQAVTISSSKFDLSIDCCFNIKAITGGYSIQSASGYYIGQGSDANGLQSSKSTVYSNSISINGDGEAVIVSSGGAYLRYNSASNQLRFRYYRSSTYSSQKAIYLYRMEDEQYAETFMETVTCNAAGTSAPTFGTSSWSNLSTAYSALSSTSKNIFKNASVNESGTIVEKAVARYDFIVRKYGVGSYTNFMNRTINQSNSLAIANINNSSIVITVTILSCLSLLAFGLIVIKKKTN